MVLSVFWNIGKWHWEQHGVTHPLLDRLLRLLLGASEREELNTACVMPNSIAHRGRIRLWQTMCALVAYVDADCAAAIAPALGASLHLSNTGSVRRYIELFAIACAVRHASVRRVIAEALQQVNAMPQVYCSLLSIAGHLLCHAPSAETARLFLPAIVGSLTSHNHRIRLHAQVMIHELDGRPDGPNWCEAAGPNGVYLRWLPPAPVLTQAQSCVELTLTLTQSCVV